MALLPIILALLVSCYLCVAQAQEHRSDRNDRTPVVMCTSEPPLRNGTLHIPLNGFAFYTCERELHENSSYERQNWHLAGQVPQRHPEIAITVSTHSEEPCLFSNKACDRMIAMFAPSSLKLQNRTMKGCTLLSNNGSYHVFCSSSAIKIKIEDDQSESTTTQSIPTTTSQTTETQSTDPAETEVTTQECSSPTTQSPSIDTGAQGTGTFGLAADSVSMCNLLSNFVQIALLLLLVFKTLCGSTTGCMSKRKRRKPNDVEAASGTIQPCPVKRSNSAGDHTEQIHDPSAEKDHQDGATDLIYTNVPHSQIDTRSSSTDSTSQSSTPELTTSLVVSNSQTE